MLLCVFFQNVLIGGEIFLGGADGIPIGILCARGICTGIAGGGLERIEDGVTRRGWYHFLANCLFGGIRK